MIPPPTALQRSGWTAIALLASIQILPRIFQREMFMDGRFYSTIAHNLAEGRGSFWHLQHSEKLWPRFSLQPPLALWLHSLIYRLFGDHFVLDRLYSVTCGLVTAGLMVVLWRRLFADARSRSLAWWPVLLWLLMPKIAWSYRNNLLENTMTMFCLASAICSVLALRRRSGILLLPATAAMCAAVLSKGLPALFCLAVPLAAWASLPGVRLGKALLATGILCLGGAAFFTALLIAYDPALEFAGAYARDHLVPGFTGQPDQVAMSRQHLLLRLICELLVPLLPIGLMAACRRSHASLKNPAPGPALFFLFQAAIASFPLLLSGKLRTHYLVPSLAFYALGIAALFLPVLRNLSISRALSVRPVRPIAAAQVVPEPRLTVGR